MNPLFLIPVLLIAAGIVFMIYMNKKHKQATESLNMDEERRHYAAYRDELLAGDFDFLPKWMKGKPIDAFTTASIPQDTRGKMKQHVGDGLKNVAMAAIGVNVQRVEADCYWVLSNQDLHLFLTDADGDLEEHVLFDHFRLEQASLRYQGVKKANLGAYAAQAEAYLPHIYEITFHLDGYALPLEIHDRLKFTPDPSQLLALEKQVRNRMKYQVVGEQLHKALQAKYSNL